MPLYRNTDTHERVWPSLVHEGATLHLAPGAEVDLDVPAGFDDAWLKPVPEPAHREAKSRRKSEEPGLTEPDATPVAPTEE